MLVDTWAEYYRGKRNRRTQHRGDTEHMVCTLWGAGVRGGNVQENFMGEKMLEPSLEEVDICQAYELGGRKLSGRKTAQAPWELEWAFTPEPTRT